jgi:hypothetical protein
MHAKALRVRPWHVEGLDATLATKQVLRLIGIEAVFQQTISTANELKLRFIDNQMQVTGFYAHRAIALQNLDD